jgi:hypothetical protein
VAGPGGKLLDEPQCAIQADNVLRVDCVFDDALRGPASVAVSRPDGTVAVFEAAEGERVVTVWGLVAESSYPYVAVAKGRSWRGQFETPALPSGVSIGLEEVSGVPSWEHLALPVACGLPAHVGVINRQGQLVWYQEIAAGANLGQTPFAEGFRFTSEQTLLVVVGRQALREFDRAGRVVFEAYLGSDYDNPIHHDVHRDGEWTYVLNASVQEAGGQSYVMDGIYVHGPDGNIVQEWFLADHAVPSGEGLPGAYWASFFGGSVDFSHGNGLWTSEGTLLVSFRALSVVMGIVADPMSTEFGEVLWVMDGDGDGRLGSDLVLTSSVTSLVGFQDQHSPSIGADGRLSLFDNRKVEEGPSRAIQLNMDIASGAAEIVESWDMGRHCAVQGSAYALPNGHVLATCAVSGTVMEFVSGQAEPVWTGRVACQKDGILPGLVVRAQPVQFGEDPGADR